LHTLFYRYGKISKKLRRISTKFDYQSYIQCNRGYIDKVGYSIQN